MLKGFQKGNTLAKGFGRQGYTIENTQLILMRKIVDKDLKLVEKIYKGKATNKDFKKLAALQVRVSKYLDKLHAGKTDINLGGELRIVKAPSEVVDLINEPDIKTIGANKE